MNKYNFSIYAALLTGLLASATTYASTVIPVTLSQLSSSADLIFHGIAISNNVKVDNISGRVATYTKFNVINAVKGEVANSHMIKQIGGKLPGGDITHKVQGIPEFITGKEYVVFLPPVSKLGFASPVALSQGKFIIHEINGIKTISKGRAQVNLYRPSTPDPEETQKIQPALKHPGFTSLQDFLQTVRSLIKN